MIHTILFLGSGSPFMVKALIGNLTKAGYEVISTEPDLRTLGRYRGKFDAAILFLGDALLTQKDILYDLSSMCAKGQKRLFVIGTPEELGVANYTIPFETVTERFEKPLNIQKLIDRLAQLNSAAATTATTAEKPKQMKQILLVDDDPDYLKLVSRWLSGTYRVVIVNSGMQAIAFLGANRPDLILLDYSMPVTSGPQVLEMIRSEKETENIPVIFLTGMDDSESVNRVLEFKPNGYILKSINRDLLLERLNEFFSKASM